MVYYWFIILDVVGWNYFNINYKLFLGFNHHYSPITSLIKRASYLTSLLMTLLLLYVIQVEYSDLPNKL